MDQIIWRRLRNLFQNFSSYLDHFHIHQYWQVFISVPLYQTDEQQTSFFTKMKVLISYSVVANMSTDNTIECSHARVYNYTDLFHSNGNPTDMLAQRKRDVYKETWCKCAEGGGRRIVSHSHIIAFFTPPQTQPSVWRSSALRIVHQLHVDKFSKPQRFGVWGFVLCNSWFSLPKPKKIRQ